MLVVVVLRSLVLLLVLVVHKVHPKAAGGSA
jgi:hypothetical protein